MLEAMTTSFAAPAFQASLFDGDGTSSGDAEASRLGPPRRQDRIALSHGAWLDVVPGWLRGADDVFERLTEVVPWRAERRWMYDQVVDVPRLLCHYGADEPLPDPALADARRVLDGYYGPELGEPLCTAGLCLYRDGQDSVAWHGDTSGRRVRETVVAIVSLGTPRALMLRPRSGAGESMRYLVGHGDLLVMGGTCQRTWEHCVPKTARPTGPRISVQFRPAGIR